MDLTPQWVFVYLPLNDFPDDILDEIFSNKIFWRTHNYSLCQHVYLENYEIQRWVIFHCCIEWFLWYFYCFPSKQNFPFGIYALHLKFHHNNLSHIALRLGNLHISHFSSVSIKISGLFIIYCSRKLPFARMYMRREKSIHKPTTENISSPTD